ncbi:ATP-binding response regulator [Bacilliculturomica massiliensis]|uniref:ATP-binding response regulator n=1 Tax=Bacilliculturomica massiliensis TaxID=1917867 RepID=UPI0010320831|nr:ATP-binding protein [Bacilliculturomica massiliensis]
MKRLNNMIILILCVTFLLVINAVAVFNYRDSVLSCETRKDSMLNFVIKYQTLADNLRSDARRYLETGDEKYATSFNEQMNNYQTMDHISLGYRTFTVLQAEEQLNFVNPEEDFTMKAQADFLNFNEQESEVYERYLQSYGQVLSMLRKSMEERDPSLILSLSMEEKYAALGEQLRLLSRDYMHRLNAEEDDVVATQNLTEFTLILLSFLLLTVAGILFYFLLKENKWNSYFRQLYTTIVENVSVGLSIINQAGEYEYMNAKYKEILGVDNPHPVGKAPEQILDKNVSAALTGVARLDQARSGGRLHLTVNHLEKYVDYDHFLIFDDNNQKKYVDLLNDITETEQMRLRQEKNLKEIEYYSNSKDSFLANMSHEIKTPINAIVGMTYFLKETPLSRKQQDLVQKIESSSDVLLAIINDVLDLSKIKSKNLTLHPTAFSLAEMIHSVEDMFLAQITGKNLAWFCDMDFVPDLCLYLDRTRLIQVLVNLINNAYKYTEEGYITLSVETKSETAELIYLEFCVEDTGIGIEPQDIHKLFKEFEQLENHLTKQHTGAGLGLSICRHIVEAMGGRMWITSTPGDGSRFYFSIPAPKADSSDVKAASPAEPAERVSFDGQGAKVLIVEDTEINLEIAQNLLETMNVECDTAANGLEAIEQCRDKAADYYRVILMDIHMPEMDGYTASEILRNEMKITTPIIALTATEVTEETSLQHRDTISGFILKPFKVETFYKTLSKYFAPSKDPAAGSEVSDPASGAGESGGTGPYAGKATAIHNLGGMESIYYKHVARFKANYPQTPDEIERLLGEGNFDEAKRHAHSVKGLAGTLGMLDLQKTAYSLEKRIAARETKLIPAALEEFSEALDEVIRTEP